MFTNSHKDFFGGWLFVGILDSTEKTDIFIPTLCIDIYR